MDRKNPCFDRSTGIDCADRCAECATYCEKWAKYVEERNKSYNTIDSFQICDRYRSDMISKFHEKRQKDKRHGRRGIMK